VLDATRCISYLTIELREAIPLDLREGVGDWLFGCDVCQEVCPWNRHAPQAAEPDLQPVAELDPIDAVSLFSLDEDAFRRRFRQTPLWRSKRRGILRNAAIVLGNRPCPAGLEALLLGLNDSELLVRAASAWALGKYQSHTAGETLRARQSTETDSSVLAEIEGALMNLDDS
jgi:epoxyqueuosine reductase